MNIYMSQTQIQYDNKANPTGLFVRLRGTNGDGEAIDCSVLLKDSDFPKDVNLRNFNLDQAKELAKQKVVKYLAPSDEKTVKNSK